MTQENQEKKALIVVDMQKENVGKYCLNIIPNIKQLLESARSKGIPIVFACDSRYADDLLFARIGRRPHTIRGSEGAKVIDEFNPQPNEYIVEKRMLSGFFGSDLDFTLRQKGITTVIVTGVATNGCVLKTALDAFELGYKVVIPADCCASPFPNQHERALKLLEFFNMVKETVNDVLPI